MSAKIIAWTISLLFIALGASGAETAKRQKVIDFEDEVVEGMNKRPLDSFNQISEANRKKKKPHLYRKRAGFRTETVQTTTEIRYVQ